VSADDLYSAANAMLSLVDVSTWVVMVPKTLYHSAEEFIGMVMRAAQGMKMPMRSPQVITIPDDRQSTYVNNLDELLSQVLPQLVVCFATNNRSDRYSAIKKICCVDRAGMQ
jgi:aubergine-like protein